MIILFALALILVGCGGALFYHSVDVSSEWLLFAAIICIVAGIIGTIVTSDKIVSEYTLEEWLCEPVGMELVQFDKDGVYCAASGETKFFPTPSKE